VPLPDEEPLRREMQAFLDAVRDPTAPIVADGAEGLRVLRVLDAAMRSLEAHGQPTTLKPVTLTPVSDVHAGAQIHPSAVVGERARLGAGTKVWHFSHARLLFFRTFLHRLRGWQCKRVFIG
jgi:UDP-2-acetamido-3-amino-2,3-dideoxy-glucuronate N-acetyltransferase